ncbi:hypothetical protein MMC25_001472 [Agyrium rufum]|nr:hypothetical protein [Agyrium rufum]
MASSAENRQTFINGLIKFMNTYGFDGIDLDWEYPAADDRGGVPADRENYVALVKDIRSAFGSQYGLSMTLPTSYWYLQHFDLSGLQGSLDWFNFMAYDLHGTWDAQSKFVGPYIAPHTNITEIDAGLDLLWRAGVTPEKVVLGTGWYGRSFTLKDSSCHVPNGVCEFTGGANGGPCSDASGILDDQEIQDIITINNLNPTWDKTAAVKWITWDSNQWVSYDDADTFQQKHDFANSRCLGGTIVWAMDQKDQTQPSGFGPAGSVTASQQADANQATVDQSAQKTCYTSDCDAGCNLGETEVSQMNGQPGQVSTKDRCATGKYESLCCADSTTMGTCTWRGYRGVGLSCIGTCADGETEVARNTNHHDKTGDYTCNGGLQSYCCSGFKAASGKSQLAQQVENAAKEAAEAAAEQAALDLAAKAFCRIAVPALLAPLELLEDIIPIFGEIADIAEIAATPELINLCTNEIEKEGKAEFKVFGKEHTLSFDKPSEPKETRPPSKTHESASTKTSSACSLPKRANGNIEVTSTVTSASYSTSTGICKGDAWPQACLHYSSVIRRNPTFERLTCTNRLKREGSPRPAPALYNAQHNAKWSAGWMQSPALRCQRDEYPPAVIWQGRDNSQWIRLLPGSQNGGAGSMWSNVCLLTPISHTTGLRSVGEQVTACRTTEHWEVTQVITTGVFEMSFINMPNYADDGITKNPCWPQTLIDDPGFALLVNDPWYIPHFAAQNLALQIYPKAPGPAYTMDLDPDSILVTDGNSTRKATDEELLDNFGFVRCMGDGCKDEQDVLGIESLPVMGAEKTSVAEVMVADTTASEMIVILPTMTSCPRSNFAMVDMPVITGSARP